MGERQTKAARSRQTWTEIEIGLLDAVIERTDALEAIIAAYERADAIGVASAIETARRVVGWSVGVSGADQTTPTPN